MCRITVSYSGTVFISNGPTNSEVGEGNDTESFEPELTVERLKFTF
jgi:hypothetical protein